MLPGGRVRRGEDPVITARREMYQELGIWCQQWKLLGCLGARDRYRRRSSTDSFRRHSTFYIHGEVETTNIDPRRGEISDARWFEAGAFPDERSTSLDVAATAGWLDVSASKPIAPQPPSTYFGRGVLPPSRGSQGP